MMEPTSIVSSADGHLMVDRPGDAGVDALVALGADPAGKAAVRLPDGLLLGEAEPHLPEIGLPLFRFEERIADPGDLGHLRDIGLVGEILRPVLRPARRHLLALQVAVDRDGRLLPGADGLDDRGRAGHDVTAGEYAGDVRRIGHRIDVEGVPFVDGDPALLRDEGEIRRLADRRDDAVAGDREFRTLDRDGTAASAGVGLAQLHPDALDPRDLPGLAEDADRGHEEFHLDPLFEGLLDLLGCGRHLRPGAAVEDEDLLRTRADGRPDGIHRDVPAADDGDPVAEGDLLAQVDPFEVIDPVDDPLELLARYVELAGEDGPAADEDGVVLLPELLERDILPDRGVEVDLHPQLLDHLDLRLENVLGEAVFGDAHGEPAAGHGQGLEDVDVVAFDRQVVRRGEPRGTGADDGDLLPLLLLDRGDEPGLFLEVEVGHKLLQVHDVDRFIHLSALACRLAGVVADPSADDGKGVVPLDEFQGFLEFPRRDQGHVPLDADVGRAGRLAGGGPQLVDRESRREWPGESDGTRPCGC